MLMWTRGRGGDGRGRGGGGKSGDVREFTFTAFSIEHVFVL